jgi:hypothetical protein
VFDAAASGAALDLHATRRLLHTVFPTGVRLDGQSLTGAFSSKRFSSKRFSSKRASASEHD